MKKNKNRAYAPHCDSSILHSPGKCQYCDEYSDWQDMRLVARIAFSDEEPSFDKSPCPSMWFRDPVTRDLWGGNVARPPRGTCKRSPEGWYCSLDAGHDGPCPARIDINVSYNF